MEMSSAIYAKGVMSNKVFNNGGLLKEGIKSRIECAGVCLTNDDCHFYTYWEKGINHCDWDTVEIGWHFNYTDASQDKRNIYMDTGIYISMVFWNLIPPSRFEGHTRAA